MSFVNTVEIIGDEALSASIIDRSITRIADNIATKIGSSAFYGCTALTEVNLPAVTSLENNAFRNTAVTAAILRGATMCALANTYAFMGTPIASGTGYIYVPAALVDSYKAATNWSTYAAQFRALEDYTVDGTTTGELDPTKI